MAERTETMQTQRKPQTPAPTSGMPLQDRGAGTQSSDRMTDIGTQVQERVQEMGTQAREWAEELGEQITEKAQAAMHQVGASAAQFSAQGRAAVGQFEKTLEDTIRERPMQAVLIAAGIGMLAGLLWRK